MRDRKPIPRNQSEVTQAALNNAYLTSQGKPTSDSIAQRHQNRALQTTRKTDKIKDISIGLEDIDYAIKYYFDTIIKPTVVQDGQRIDVPVRYASPERWKSVQQDGYYRDTNGKLVLPVIMYKRDGVEKNRSLGNKIDGNLASLFQVFETRYNQRNQYDRFSILNNRIPSKQYYVSVVPDYVTITYSVSIFTNYVEQNNKIIEAIEFASDSYWGQENRWHFRTMLDSFSTTNIINSGEDKAAVTTVTLKVNGYLIADSINKHLADTGVHYSTSQVVFGLEVVDNPTENFNAVSQVAASQGGGQTSFVGGGTNVTNVNSNALNDAISTYLNLNYSVTSNIIDAAGITVYFPNHSIVQPPAGSNLPPTSINNFTFQVGALPITLNDISDFYEASGTVTLVINPSVLGYNLIGKRVTMTGKLQFNTP
jgi:hypothetical protein